MKFKKDAFFNKVIFSAILIGLLSAPVYAFAATYTGTGFIAKSFKIDNIATVTGSILYQKGTFKDTVVYEGINNNALTSEFSNYIGDDFLKKYTLPDPNGQYKFKYEVKKSSSYTFAKMKIYSSGGTNWLKCNQG